ncbi:MAG: histidine ammonia-lyase [Bdellovibrionaceae bacterium]|nr:histidine ammonia-lyase [Bdellovibrionales bacterium]MCB9084488.1 histidine ammonia-lyase [Pseudobdellovibrionaceae bacterium]
MEITGQDIDMEQVWQIAYCLPVMKVGLSPDAAEKMQISRRYITDRMERGDVMYGVNTGFGAFSDVKISHEDTIQLQKNLIRSHCTGVGQPFSKPESRAIMFLRANALARGHSGIRVEVVEKILEFLNHDVVPVIPQQGSVGASGDLAPLSHLALALMGEGEVWDGKKHIPSMDLLNKKGIAPLELQAKEGLSLINGCQVMTAVGLLNCYEARRLAWMVDLGGAMSLEALQGSRKAFDPLIASERPHPGEAKTARNLLKLLGPTSQIGENHASCTRVQDAYSLRCMPAVHGAAKDTLRNTCRTLEIEANSSTDNPLVFAEENKVLSCGNFHGEPVAFALDFLGIAMSAMSSISECRIEKLINPAMSGLPAFLAPKGGLNSGMMIVQVSAASLVSENKILSHPASVDSIPTSADKEDHVSMGTIASRKLGQIVRNAENIVAMELLCASQGLGLLAPMKAAAGVNAAYETIRQSVPFAEEDRVFYRDIEAIKEMIRSEDLLNSIHNSVGDLEW